MAGLCYDAGMLRKATTAATTIIYPALLVCRWAGRLAEGVGLVGLLALAGLLRLGWPGVNSYGFDEARVSLLALQMARRGEIATVGISSSAGVPNFPALVWIMALPYALSPDPLVATLFVASLGVLAVAGVWYLARAAWGPWAALAAGLLMASSPFAVLYARSIWGQNLLPPLAVLWAVAGVASVRRGGGWALALHLFISGLAGQVHYAGLALLPASAFLLLRSGLWRRWRPLLAGGALAALLALPFFYSLWSSAPQLQATLRSLAGRAARLDLSALKHWLEVAVGANWEWLPLGPGWRWPQSFAWAQWGARLTMGALAGSGLLWLARSHLTGSRKPVRSDPMAMLVLAWALAVPAVFLYHSTPVYHQYQVMALPALCLAAGALVGAAPRRARWLLVGLVMAISLVQAAALGRSLDVIARRLSPGGLGTPLLYPRAAARSLMDGRPVLVHAYSDQPEFDADAAGFGVLFWGYPCRVIDGRSALLLPPEGQSAYLLAVYAGLPAWREAVAAGLGPVRELPRREGEEPYLAMEVDGSPPPGFVPVEPVSLANGARLRGWRTSWIDSRLQVATWWEIAGPLRSDRYHQFNHLRGPGAGEPLAVRDGPVSSAAWQVGDTLITWAEFEVAGPGPYWVDVGMYTYPQVERVPVLGREGDPLAPIRLGPVEGPPGR